jgi:glycosyltransferase involved in cell wall biosynthesis
MELSSEIRGPKRRLAVVLSHPIQYYSPWFRSLAANSGLTLRVFYLSDFGLRPARDEKFGQTFAWDVDLTSGYDWEVVPNLARVPDTLRYSGLKNPALFARLRAWKPDAVLLFGYKYHTHLRLILRCRLSGIPLIFRGDSHLLGRSHRRLPWTTICALTFLYRQFSAVAYVGQANRAYFKACGVPDENLFFAPHSVDDSLFDPGRPEHTSASERLRASLQISLSAPVVLFSGKFISSKQPRALLEAFLHTDPRDAVLVLAGDGPEKPELERLAAGSANVRFLPFANQQEMPARYLLADVLALPSKGCYETWGLAVNEAMHLGVPCLVSDHVGCQQDLVTPGETGWVFTWGNDAGLSQALAEALQDVRTNRAGFRKNVRARIAQYTYAQAARGLIHAFNHATS